MTKNDVVIREIQEKILDIMHEAAVDAGFFVDGDGGIYVGEHGEIDITDEMQDFSNTFLHNVFLLIFISMANPENKH